MTFKKKSVFYRHEDRKTINDELNDERNFFSLLQIYRLSESDDLWQRTTQGVAYQIWTLASKREKRVCFNGFSAYLAGFMSLVNRANIKAACKPRKTIPEILDSNPSHVEFSTI